MLLSELKVSHEEKRIKIEILILFINHLPHDGKRKNVVQQTYNSASCVAISVKCSAYIVNDKPSRYTHTVRRKF